jgi:hypothetical protein
MALQAPLALRVGVTGHRADKLREESIARVSPLIATTLQRLRDVAQRAQAARLQVVSPLAEGADRLVARLALEQGAELIAPLPFPRDQYLEDFSSVPSKAEFDALLKEAREVITLKGNRATEQGRKAAYAAVGAAVVDKSDLLLALWNGEAADGHGGTAEVVQSARRAGRAVLWLPTTAAPPQLLLADGVIADQAIDAFVQHASDILAKRLAGAR